ncbi:hypothetical protein Taro_026781, partial [Colocasia esculenta]|nr:hypothetical protein [Colocasia esculenta]
RLAGGGLQRRQQRRLQLQRQQQVEAPAAGEEGHDGGPGRRQRWWPLLLPPAAVTGGGAGGGSCQRRRCRGKQRRQRQQGNSKAAVALTSSSPPPLLLTFAVARPNRGDLPPTAAAESLFIGHFLQAGTWEEKNLNSWASNRIKEMLKLLGSLEFSNGKAEVSEVSKCVGDAFLVTVRNKKRVGYTYELSLEYKGKSFCTHGVAYTIDAGEWTIGEETKKLEGHLDIPEFSFGELDDLQVEVRISEEKGLSPEDKAGIRNDMKSFLPLIREKLQLFEDELRDR